MVSKIVSPAISRAVIQAGAPLHRKCMDAWRRRYAHQDIVAGAGHDACYLAAVCPASMVFVPCIDGISHNEVEDAYPEWITAGGNVLFTAMLERAVVVN